MNDSSDSNLIRVLARLRSVLNDRGLAVRVLKPGGAPAYFTAVATVAEAQALCADASVAVRRSRLSRWKQAEADGSPPQ